MPINTDTIRALCQAADVLQEELDHLAELESINDNLKSALKDIEAALDHIAMGIVRSLPGFVHLADDEGDDECEEGEEEESESTDETVSEHPAPVDGKTADPSPAAEFFERIRQDGGFVSLTSTHPVSIPTCQPPPYPFRHQPKNEWADNPTEGC